MVEASRDTVQLISGLIGHMRQIVGDGACYAMLHYGAMEEGKRFGAGASATELSTVLSRLDELLLQRSEILKDDGSTVTIRVHSSAFLDSNQRAMQGVILGLVEGALTASRSGRYKGTVLNGNGELLVELKRDA